MIEKDDKAQRRGLLINITGPGKGKTTSALGTALRALGWGWKVAVVQFMKSDKTTGEKRFAETSALPLKIHTMGAGFLWRKNADHAEDAASSEAAWNKAEEYLLSNEIDLLILDELNIALNHNLIDRATVINALKQRPTWLHVIVTGRGAVPEIIAASDLVSEINEIKHPFKSGIHAQKGIEY